MNRAYSFVIFDWDGTLMDSTARIISCMQETARIANLPVPTASAVKSTIGLSMDAVLDKMFPRSEKSRRAELTDIYRQQYIELDTTPSPLFEGSLSLLNWLKEQGVLTAVATGKARVGLNRALQSVDMMDFFEYSICADEAQSKPHPEMVHQLLAKTGKNAEQTLVIGDSVHDMKMANNAGVDVIGVTSGANTYEELLIHTPLKIYDEVHHVRGLFSVSNFTIF
jgi:phosphoglycolate phosphatase